MLSICPQRSGHGLRHRGDHLRHQRPENTCLEAGQPTGLATAGLVLSIIGLTLSAISFFTCTLCVTCVGFVL